jgi:hypothetical protein
MGVMPSGRARSAATRLESQSFWQRIAQSLDRFFAKRSRQAVAASIARRSKYDIKRCHQLMSQCPNLAAGSSHERAIRLIATFLTMVIAEWRKLVAEISHSFAGRRDRRRASKREGGGP